MSEGKSAPETNRLASSPCFVCAEEAAALLNCAAEKKYNEMRCYPLIKKLRACVEKKVSTSCTKVHLGLSWDCNVSLTHISHYCNDAQKCNIYAQRCLQVPTIIHYAGDLCTGSKLCCPDLQGVVDFKLVPEPDCSQ